ncbi:MAG TPA: hypothetical protein VMV78_14520 [Thiobacillus sp.]|nr:hypothetical protein [Thiobacillus sp.]
MYARITTFQADPSKLDAIEKMTDSIREQLKKVSGLTACYTCVNESGSGVTVAVYESQEHADRGSDQTRAIWASLASLLTAPPNIQTYDNVTDLKA